MTEINSLIPLWEKPNLTLKEASAYFNIGINKMRTLSDSPECTDCVIWDGNRRLIRRENCEHFIDTLSRI